MALIEKTPKVINEPLGTEIQIDEWYLVLTGIEARIALNKEGRECKRAKLEFSVYTSKKYRFSNPDKPYDYIVISHPDLKLEHFDLMAGGLYEIASQIMKAKGYDVKAEI